VTSGEDGVRLTRSNHNRIDHSSIFGTGDAIALLDSDMNRLEGNSIYANSTGINLETFDDFNQVERNSIRNNEFHGIFLAHARHNQLSGTPWPTTTPRE
jgi:parallel beta-helix repeat protein